VTSTVPRSAGFGCMPKGCVITRYAESSDFLYNGFAIRLRIFSCRLARSYFLFLFLPIVRRGAVRSNVTAERSSGAENLGLCGQECPIECGQRNHTTGASLSTQWLGYNLRIIVAPRYYCKPTRTCTDELSEQKFMYTNLRDGFREHRIKSYSSSSLISNLFTAFALSKYTVTMTKLAPIVSGIVKELTMMPSTGNNVHTSSLVTSSLEVVYRGHATHWVHPVMLAVYIKPQRGSERTEDARTDEGYGNFQR
jgi:hypothetical protein